MCVFRRCAPSLAFGPTLCLCSCFALLPFFGPLRFPLVEVLPVLPGRCLEVLYFVLRRYHVVGLVDLAALVGRHEEPSESMGGGWWRTCGSRRMPGPFPFVLGGRSPRGDLVPCYRQLGTLPPWSRPSGLLWSGSCGEPRPFGEAFISRCVNPGQWMKG